jgi:hypothetical protein
MNVATISDMHWSGRCPSIVRTDFQMRLAMEAYQRGEQILITNFESSIDEERLKAMLNHRNPEHEDYMGEDATQDESYETEAQRRIRYGNNKKKRSKDERKTTAKIVKKSKKRNR